MDSEHFGKTPFGPGRHPAQCSCMSKPVHMQAISSTSCNSVSGLFCAQAWVPLSATRTAARANKPGMKDYNYTQIADPATLKASLLVYTAATGANLTVRRQCELKLFCWLYLLVLHFESSLCQQMLTDELRKALAQAYVSYINTTGSWPLK